MGVNSHPCSSNQALRRASASMYLSIHSGSVTYLSLLINPSARIVSSEILFRRRGAFFGFVLLDSSFKNLATSLRISSAETFLSVDLLSFFSLESSWREVLPPRPLPPYPMTDFTFKHARVRVGTQILVLCFWAG